MKILENFSLKNYNTFAVDVSARFFVTINTIAELLEVLNSEEWKNHEHFVLGGGSNVLFTKDIDAIVLLNQIKGISKLESDESEIKVEIGAGEVWHEAVLWAVNQGFGGIENLSLIPGCVGAAPIQNIGAYGSELKDVFDSLKAVRLSDGELMQLSASDCKFGYRDSIFKNEAKDKYFICSVTLNLSKNAEINSSYGAIEDQLEIMGVDKASYKDISDAVCEIRRSKLPDPAVIGNAGSFFKNPVVENSKLFDVQKIDRKVVSYAVDLDKSKLAAGWLIEACGWKGRTVGNAGTHKNQALVIVNHGGATGQEIYDLSSEIIASVESKFGVTLEREVNVF